MSAPKVGGNVPAPKQVHAKPQDAKGASQETKKADALAASMPFFTFISEHKVVKARMSASLPLNIYEKEMKLLGIESLSDVRAIVKDPQKDAPLQAFLKKACEEFDLHTVGRLMELGVKPNRGLIKDEGVAIGAAKIFLIMHPRK